MRVLIFGTGDYYELYKEWFKNINVVGLVDNDQRKWNTYIDGRKVFSPEEVRKLNVDKVFILNLYFHNKIREQLIDIGYPGKSIFTYDDIIPELQDLIRMDEVVLEYSYKRILLVTNELKQNGAQIALLHMASILRKFGFAVSVMAMLDGSLREEYETIGVRVIINRNLYIGDFVCLPELDGYMLAVVNTIRMYHLFRRFNKTYHVLWWVHEPESMYRGHEVAALDFRQNEKIHVIAASPRAIVPFQKRCPHWKTGDILLAGVEEFVPSDIDAQNTDKVIFSVISGVIKLKGQHIFLEAIEKLSEEIKERCEFWIVGGYFSEFGHDVLCHAERMSHVKVFGELQHDFIKNVILPQTTVVVCPSEDETLSLSVIEGMICEKPCIVSKGAGISDYLEDGLNSLLYEPMEVDELVEKMVWMVNHPIQRATMGIQGREVYEKVFSAKIFERNLMEMIRMYVD